MGQPKALSRSSRSYLSSGTGSALATDGCAEGAVAGGEVGGDGVGDALAALVVAPGALQFWVVGELGDGSPGAARRFPVR
jgi:hypothetical protein